MFEKDYPFFAISDELVAGSKATISRSNEVAPCLHLAFSNEMGSVIGTVYVKL